ncbi:hypothetical protein AYO20_03213 [Fonsecaea nubica]|uniref:Cation/H+ exchanger transmembrane domain-containing protein n=1 Tax=Fonsecaea nubica TaxID=856822 RepID=A0A178D7L6_9EURO|nr:hypothetical protein AYO20_03213 [Fonsecaea nubica]OAL37364.1 hypothetical protein AYO20_03213 [Fonsecaea nubica]
MATATVTELITKTVNGTAASSTSTLRAAPQGGVFEHVNPSRFDPKNPLILFIIQASIVIVLCRLIHIPLAYLRQPRVIAEVVTGILLGPSVFGRIPGFTSHIFPPASMPGFLLVANIGLVLFLFLVGLEVDLRFLLRNWRVAVSVGVAGMALPFGFGAAIAWGLYHEFRDEPGTAAISFGVYMLFIGVAMAITAFPVLCRILTSLDLVGTPVGVIVLSAGIGNDVTGWILLALCVVLVNSSTGVTAVWILLVSLGYVLFLTFLVRPCFMYLLRRTGSLANGPSQTMVALTILLTLASAFFTGIIGIHPIFGAFAIGLMLPHDGGFAIKLTEKIEDLISVLFLPLYFATSGLSTNLGLLDSGITWAYVVGICAIAFITKVTGGTLASRLNGLVWRESFAIGCLMSCKGVVELVVLNIGLQAKILSTRTFTMFVVMTLVTTFATTPLTMWLYPPWYQKKLEMWKQGKIDWNGNPIHHDDSDDGARVKANVAQRVLVYLRLDGLASIFTLVSLFAHDPESIASTAPPPTDGLVGRDDPVAQNLHTMGSAVALRRPLSMHGLRLMELTDRESSVMRVSQVEEFAPRDPVIKTFGAFTQSCGISANGQIAVVPGPSFSSSILSRARELGSQLVLVPWSESGNMSDYPSPFDEKPADPLANKEFTAFMGELFKQANSTCHVAVFIEPSIFRRSNIPSLETLSDKQPRQSSRMLTERSMTEPTNHGARPKPATGRRCRLFCLYTGHDDDLFAVRLGLQLAKNQKVDLRVLVARAFEDDEEEDLKDIGGSSLADHDFLLLRNSVDEAIAKRVSFDDLPLPSLEAVSTAVADPSAAETIMIVGRRTGDLAVEAAPSRSEEIAESSRCDESHVLGTTAMNLMKAARDKDLGAGFLVVQACSRGE